MSKITFRADDELVERLEAANASKSEVMRDALRAYFEPEPNGREQTPIRQAEPVRQTAPLDDLVRERVDAVLQQQRQERHEHRPVAESGPETVHINITLDGIAELLEVSDANRQTPQPPADEQANAKQPANTQCGQCGETVAPSHVFCPNCGEKASRRLFCDCGDELRSDWSFCPGCGRRTPAADVLDSR